MAHGAHGRVVAALCLAAVRCAAGGGGASDVAGRVHGTLGVTTTPAPLLWDRGAIAYYIDTQETDTSGPGTGAPRLSDGDARIAAAINIWENATCLMFTPCAVGACPDAHLRFISTSGVCRAPLGRASSGATRVYVSTSCAAGEVVHQIGHAVGLANAHERADAGAHVVVDRTAVAAGMLPYFDKLPAGVAPQALGAYDYNSVMHLAEDAYAAGAAPTLNAPQAIGQRDAVSPGDIDAVAFLYNNCLDDFLQPAAIASRDTAATTPVAQGEPWITVFSAAAGGRVRVSYAGTTVPLAMLSIPAGYEEGAIVDTPVQIPVVYTPAASEAGATRTVSVTFTDEDDPDAATTLSVEAAVVDGPVCYGESSPSAVCSGHGTCTAGDPKCRCDPGYHGITCDGTAPTATCPDVWLSQARNYFGCQRAEGRDAPWCLDGDGVDQLCAPDACVCEATWTYRNATYKGCAETGEDYSWCYLDLAAAPCTCALPAVGERAAPWRVCGMPGPGVCPAVWRYEGNDYLGCQQAAGRDEPWCLDTTGADRPCTPTGCVCQSSWEYDNAEYVGCAHTGGGDNFLWCYVNETSAGACEVAFPARDLRTQRWRICGWTTPPPPAPCAPVWAHNGATYFGCQHADAFNHPDPWCVGTDGTEQNCSITQCACADTWDFEGRTYGGCADTGSDVLWCYVNDTEVPCGRAMPADGARVEPWVVCGIAAAVEDRCPASWVYGDVNYLGCQLAEDRGAPWCVDATGAETVCDVTDGCPCRANWTHNDAGYAGCADTGDGFLWCYVDLTGGGCDTALPATTFRDGPWKICGYPTPPDPTPVPPTPAPATPAPITPAPATPAPVANTTATATTTGGDPNTTTPAPPGGNGTTDNATVTEEPTPAPLVTPVPPAPGGDVCDAVWGVGSQRYLGCQRTADRAAPWCLSGGREVACSDTSCACLPTWEYGGRTHVGCAKAGADPILWCYVDAAVVDGCAGAAALPAGGDRTAAWRICGWETAAAEGVACPAVWEAGAGDRVYFGCTRAEARAEPWCVDGTGEAVCVPDAACACRATWSHMGDNYTGCADTGEPYLWCETTGACADAIPAGGNHAQPWRVCGWNVGPDNATGNACPARWAWEGRVYLGCQPVDGGEASCPTASGDRRACTPAGCACAATWQHDGRDYVGCADTGDGYLWCYVDTLQGPCNTAVPAGGGKAAPWQLCGWVEEAYANECKTAWTWNDVTYFGCQQTPDAAGVSVCEKREGGGRKECMEDAGGCGCEPVWTFEGESYSGCAFTSPEDELAWCYLEATARCAAARPASGGRDRSWVVCAVRAPVPSVVPERDPTCSGQWVFGSVAYLGCRLLAPFTLADVAGAGGAPPAGFDTVKDLTDRGLPVCRTLGNRYLPCHNGMGLIDPLPDPFPADDCQCRASWEYRSEVFSGCAAPDPADDYAWCSVGAACQGAYPPAAGRDAPWMFCGLLVKNETDAPAPTPFPPTSAPVSFAPTSAPTTSMPSTGTPVTAAPNASASLVCNASWSLGDAVYFGCERMPAEVLPDSVRTDATVNDVCFDEEGTLAECEHDAPACLCAETWAHDGKAHHGCSGTGTETEYRWCYLEDGYGTAVEDGVPVPHACASALPPGPRRRYPWRVCGYMPAQRPVTLAPVEDRCLPRWTLPHDDAVEYFGCQIINNSATGYCMLPGEGDLVECDPQCRCKQDWVYRGSAYNGCAQPDATSIFAWCFVQASGACRHIDGPSASPPSVVCGINTHARAAAAGDGDNSVALWILILVVVIGCCCVAALLMLLRHHHNISRRHAQLSCLPTATTIEDKLVSMLEEEPCPELTELEWEGSPYGEASRIATDRPPSKMYLMKTFFQSVRKSL